MDKKRMLIRAKTQIEALSPELRQMWDELINTHPWIKRDNSKLSNLTNR
ncbi:MAG: hypothetical protein ACKPCP_22090 [Sphaerospermopsis kisseleviana]